MTAPLKSIEGTGDIAAAMADIGHSARAAARLLALAPTAQKDKALKAMAAALRAQNGRHSGRQCRGPGGGPQPPG